MYKKKDKLNKVRKDWIKGERSFNKHRSFDEDKFENKQKIKPKNIDISRIDDYDNLPLGLVIQCESGRYFVELLGQQNDKSKIIKTNFNKNESFLNKESNTIDINVDKSKKVDKNEKIIISCQIKRGVSGDNDNSTIVVIGDKVRVQRIDDFRGLICYIEKRKTHLGRKTRKDNNTEQVIAANIDSLVCLISADRPDFRRNIIDRFIVAALLGEVEPIIVLNKIDSISGELKDMIYEEMEIYNKLGYKLLFISCLKKTGIKELQKVLKNKISSLIGQSGVGKSTLANILTKNNDQKVGEVRVSDSRGRHTTIGSKLLELKSGGRLADTPGLREFGIWDLLPEELDGYFVEFKDFLQNCKFKPCTHTHEPECAVIKAVESGKIDEGRYDNYLSIFESLKLS